MDSEVLIFHLEKVQPFEALSRMALEHVASGKIQGIISASSIIELYSGPYKSGDKILLERLEEFILNMPNTIIQAVDYNIASHAARIIADTGLSVRQALLLAAASSAKKGCLLTGDQALKNPPVKGLKVLIMQEFIQQ
jgi:predicted nucleic acid-binding protein